MGNKKRKVLPKTATIANDSVSTKKATVVSGNTCADTGTEKVAISPASATAKITKNLDSLALIYRRIPNHVHGFITDLSKALLLKKHESSQYGSFLLPNGERFVLRISNHNARVSNFDKRGEQEGLSIVISSYKNKRILNDGIAHVTEYFCNRKLLETSGNSPLEKIINSIKLLLATGEYKDTTGLAERQEVNL